MGPEEEDGAAAAGAGRGGGVRGKPQDLFKGCEVVNISERRGHFRKAVPTMPLCLAVACLVLNVVLPGTGTLVSAFASLRWPSEMERARDAFGRNLLAAFLQVLTLVVLVGYIWSVFWGVTFVALALEKKAADDKLPEQV